MNWLYYETEPTTEEILILNKQTKMNTAFEVNWRKLILKQTNENEEHWRKLILKQTNENEHLLTNEQTNKHKWTPFNKRTNKHKWTPFNKQTQMKYHFKERNLKYHQRQRNADKEMNTYYWTQKFETTATNMKRISPNRILV